MTFQPSLIPPAGEQQIPLAHRMRPETLEAFLGQERLLGPGKPLRETIERGAVGSMVFWGPPGSGKTTLARLVANYTDRARPRSRGSWRITRTARTCPSAP